MNTKTNGISMIKDRILSACVAALLVAAGVLAGTIERNALSAGFGEEDGDALELTACPEVVCVGKTSELTVTINRVCGSGTVITIKPSGTVVGDSITIPAGSLLASKTTRPLNTPGTLTVKAEFNNVAVPIMLTDTAEIDVVDVALSVDIKDQPPNGKTYASGINMNSIILKLNGAQVNPTVTDIPNGKHVEYKPAFSELNIPGNNTVELKVRDNANAGVEPGGNVNAAGNAPDPAPVTWSFKLQ